MSDESSNEISIPPPDECWAAPPPKDKGDDTREAIYLRVGEALSTWELVEVMLANMFRVFVDSKSEAASRAFGAILASNGRAEALHEAAKIYAIKNADSFSLESFEELMIHVRKASSRRNEIAHGMVVSYLFGSGSKGNFLVPAWYNSRKNSATPKIDFSKEDWTSFGIAYRYTSDDIKHFNERFSILGSLVQQVLSGKILVRTRPKISKHKQSRSQPKKK